MTKPVKRRGHPLVPIDIKRVEKLAARGLTQEQICDAIGISVQTMINRKRENVELLEAIKRGNAHGIAAVTNALYDQALDGNTSAAIFYLKNRAGWKDKVEFGLDDSLPLPLIIQLPPEGPVIDVKPEPVPTLGSKKAG